VGLPLGRAVVGVCVGNTVGFDDGCTVGCTVGEEVRCDGATVGFTTGCIVGSTLGRLVVGICVGIVVSLADGRDDGREDGASVTDIGANVLNENGNSMIGKDGDSDGAYTVGATTTATVGDLVRVEKESEGAIEDVGELEYCDPVDDVGKVVGPDGNVVGCFDGLKQILIVP